MEERIVALEALVATQGKEIADLKLQLEDRQKIHETWKLLVFDIPRQLKTMNDENKKAMDELFQELEKRLRQCGF